MIDPGTMQMAEDAGGTPEEIMERAEKMQKIFNAYGLVVTKETNEETHRT